MVTVGLGMLVKTVIEIRNVVTKSRKPNFIVVFLEPVFRGRRHKQSFLISPSVEKSSDISETRARGLTGISLGIETMDSTLMVSKGFFVLLISRQAVRQHPAGLHHQPFVSRESCNLKTNFRQRDAPLGLCAARLPRIKVGVSNLLPDFVKRVLQRGRFLRERPSPQFLFRFVQ